MKNLLLLLLVCLMCVSLTGFSTGTINHCSSGRFVSARYVKIVPPLSADEITVSFGRGFKHPGDPDNFVIHLNADSAYTVDVDVSGTVLVYDASHNFVASADFTVTLAAGTTLKTQTIDITLPDTPTHPFNFTNLSSNPTTDGTRAIVVTGVSTL